MEPLLSFYSCASFLFQPLTLSQEGRFLLDTMAQMEKKKIITTGVCNVVQYTGSDTKNHSLFETIIKLDDDSEDSKLEFKLLILYDEEKREKFKVFIIY